MNTQIGYNLHYIKINQLFSVISYNSNMYEDSELNKLLERFQEN